MGFTVNFFGTPFRDLFGYSLDSKGDRERRDNVLPGFPGTPGGRQENPSFVAPQTNDGSIVYEYGSGAQVATVSFEELYQSKNDLTNRYREMAIHPECDMAIDDVINGMIVKDDNRPVVSIGLDNLRVSDQLKDTIREEFAYTLKLLNFGHNYYELPRRWYVDGELYHHMVINPKKPSDGIQELRYIDPRQIRKVKGVEKVKDPRSGIDVVVNVEEFYLFNPMGIISGSSYTGIPIAVDAISYCHSGLLNKNNNMVLSHLHKAIKPLNQLKMIEDAVVIYRITRAPERRVFYIDVGNLPTNRAEQYVKNMMDRFKNRLVYNAITGEAGDDRRYLAMQEDFWLPRREGGKGTQIDTLQGGQNLGEMSDVDYFMKKLYKALNVPISRLDPTNGFNMGRTAEINRDEMKFGKFISRLRNRFSALFSSVLRVQLILKGITSEEGWDEMEEYITYEYASDSYFAEIKNSEMLRDRLDLLEKVEPYIGRYYSHSGVRKNILMQSDEEIRKTDAENKDEGDVGLFAVRSGKVVAAMNKEPDKPEGQNEPPEGEGEIEQKFKPDTKVRIHALGDFPRVLDGDSKPGEPESPVTDRPPTKYMGVDPMSALDLDADEDEQDEVPKNTSAGSKPKKRKKVQAGKVSVDNGDAKTPYVNGHAESFRYTNGILKEVESGDKTLNGVLHH